MADYSAPKGMRDFLPEEAEIRERAIGKIKEVYKRFGFEPMETPALEATEVLEKKCGEEIKGQLFRIEGNKLALRFDLTVPLARVASSKTFPKPFKRYCIAPVWRREEPQKGRFREFYQADADIIGCQSVRAEAELIACAWLALKELGFEGAKVRLNDRRVAFGIASSILEGKEGDVLRILDKRGKVKDSEILDMLCSIGADRGRAEGLLSRISGLAGNSERVAFAARYSPEAAKSMAEIIGLVKGYFEGIEIEVDLSLVRGLDYYTGAIFEISLGGGMGSVAGGGRYDGLLSMYGQGDFAVGISLGFERLMALALGKGTAQKREGVFVANTKEELYPYAVSVASRLRLEGIACHTDLNARSLKKQMEYASARRCRHIIIIGDREKESGRLTLRDLESGQEEELSLPEIAQKLRTFSA